MTLKFYQAGDVNNPTVVLLHGGGTLHRFWQPQLEVLSQHFHVIAPDLIYEDWRTFTIERLAQDVVALIRPHGKSVHLVGLSLGGAVALQIASTSPEWVSSLIVTGAQYAPGKGYGGTLLGLAIKGVFRAVPERLLLSTLLRTLVTIYPQLSEDARAEVYRVGKAGFVAAINALTAADLSAQLPKIRVPTLVMVGALDQPGLRQAAKEIAVLIPDAELKIISRVGHAWNLQNPEMFNQSVMGFINLIEVKMEQKKA